LSVCPWPVFLSVQAEEGRRAPKAKVAKIIKETILLFSCHHSFLFIARTDLHLTLFVDKSQQKKNLACDQGKSPPRLHKARVEANRINVRSNIEAYSPTPD
jgi:hypothetical protein